MRYREEIRLLGGASLFIIALLVLAGLYMLIDGIGDAVIPIAAVFLFILLFGGLLITITDNTLRISFGYIGLIKKDIPLSEIQETRVVEYRPIRQFGGWGIRCGKFEGEKTACFSLKGKRGLLILLKNKGRTCFMRTDRILIGCHEPERLKASIGNSLLLNHHEQYYLYDNENRDP